jgi:hypothetical protein
VAATCKLEIFLVPAPSADHKNMSSVVYLNSLGEDKTQLLSLTAKPENLLRTVTLLTSKEEQKRVSILLVSVIARVPSYLLFSNRNIIDKIKYIDHI